MIQTKWYKCVDKKCNWKGQNTDFIYKGFGLNGRKRICPLCGDSVVKTHKIEEENGTD